MQLEKLMSLVKILFLKKNFLPLDLLRYELPQYSLKHSISAQTITFVFYRKTDPQRLFLLD